LKVSSVISDVPAAAAALRSAATADLSSSTADRFHLTGPSVPLDARIHAYRSDLADIALAGRVLAPHYARPLPRACGSRHTPIWPHPRAEGDAVSELLPGEDFQVLEYAAGWAWGYCRGDHVVGDVEAIELADRSPATHIVCEKCAPVTAEGGIAATVLAYLPMGARLHGTERGACLLTEYGCVPLSHLRRIEDHDDDPVVVAERLIGVKWRAGGRSYEGVDAGGLVQLALSLCGLEAPRFVEQQRSLGVAIPDEVALRRGDLVVCGEIAGLMIDDYMMIHASSAACKVTADSVLSLDRPGLERRRLPL
jgi:hypothetical protein